MIGDVAGSGDETLMRLTLEEAQAAANAGDVPVGAVAVLAGAVVGRQHNRKEEWNDPTAHAEILLLREVANRLGRWRLPDVTIYCTMEPCAMCAGAMIQARIGRLVYAVPDMRAGAAGTVFDVLQSPALNHHVEVTSGVLAGEARTQLDSFFARLRQRGAVVLGVSADPVASHTKFKAKFHLNFPLLSDADKEVVQAYGVWKEKSMYGRTYMGIERTTFIIDEDGKIARIFPKVQVDGHLEEVLAAL